MLERLPIGAHLLQVDGEPSVGMAPAGTYFSAICFLAAAAPAQTRHCAETAQASDMHDSGFRRDVRMM